MCQVYKPNDASNHNAEKNQLQRLLIYLTQLIAMSPLFILYAYPDWKPAGFRIHLYLAEKRVPQEVVAVPTDDADAETRGFPARRGNFCPIMAVARSGAAGGYEWIEQSTAILEMLEDYHDANPGKSPIPSLRGPPSDIVHRAKIRGVMCWADALFELFGMNNCFGNYSIASARGFTANATLALEIESMTRVRVLEPLEGILSEIMDCEGIATGKEGALTLAAITLYCTWTYCASLCGKDPTSQYPNFKKFACACQRRKTIQHSEFPEQVRQFAAGWYDGMWA